MAPPPSVPGAPSPWPIPTFHFRIENVGHPGAGIFLTTVRVDTALYDAVVNVCKWLYSAETVPRRCVYIFNLYQNALRIERLHCLCDVVTPHDLLCLALWSCRCSDDMFAPPERFARPAFHYLQGQTLT